MIFSRWMGVLATFFAAGMAGCTSASSRGPAPTSTPVERARVINAHLDPDATIRFQVDLKDSIRPAVQSWSLSLGLTGGSLAALYFTMADKALASLGFYSVEAYGFSSTPMSDGYSRTKAFLVLPAEREGIFRAIDVASKPFAAPEMAPSGSDLIIECEMDPVEAGAALRRAAADSLGILMLRILEEQASALGPGMPGISDAIGNSLTGRFLLIGRLSRDSSISAKSHEGREILVPRAEFVIAAQVKDAALYEALLAGRNGRARIGGETIEGNRRIMHLASPPGLNYGGGISAGDDGEYFYFASSEQLLKDVFQCRSGESKPASGDPDFQATARNLPKTGNAFYYASGLLMDKTAPIFAAMGGAASGPGDEDKTIAEILRQIWPPTGPVAGVRASAPEGLEGTVIAHGPAPQAFVQMAGAPVALLFAWVLPGELARD